MRRRTPAWHRYRGESCEKDSRIPLGGRGGPPLANAKRGADAGVDDRRADAQRGSRHRRVHRQPGPRTRGHPRRTHRRRRLRRRYALRSSPSGGPRHGSTSRSSIAPRVSVREDLEEPLWRASRPPARPGCASWTPTSSIPPPASRRLREQAEKAEERPRGRVPLPRRRLDRGAECSAHARLALARRARTRRHFPSVSRGHRSAHGLLPGPARRARPHGLRPHGFKILLEILVRSPKLAVSEIAFQFGERPAGESKASMREVARYLTLVWRLRLGTAAARASVASASSGSAASPSTRSPSSPSEAGSASACSPPPCSRRSALRSGTSCSSSASSSATTPPARSYRGRAVAFLAMNNLAFVLRGPLLLGLDERLRSALRAREPDLALHADGRALCARRPLDLGHRTLDARALRHPRSRHGRLRRRPARAGALPRPGARPIRRRSASPSSRSGEIAQLGCSAERGRRWRSSPIASPYPAASRCASRERLGPDRRQPARAPLSARALYQLRRARTALALRRARDRARARGVRRRRRPRIPDHGANGHGQDDDDPAAARLVPAGRHSSPTISRSSPRTAPSARIRSL